MPEPSAGAGKTIRVAIAGDLDFPRKDELYNLIATLDPAAGTTIEVDLSEVDFVDSSGISTILMIRNFLLARQCSLRVVDPHRRLRPQLERRGLGDLVAFDDAAEGDTG
jgi:anti-anti-sigma factor